MPPRIVFTLSKPPLIPLPLMQSNISVSNPRKDSMVVSDSVSPDAHASPTSVAREHQVDHVEMGEILQDHNSQMSDSAKIGGVSPVSVPQERLKRPNKRIPAYEGPPTTREEVIRVSLAVHDMEARHTECPAGFDTLGRLRHSWGHLRKEIQQAKARQSASEAAKDVDPVQNDPLRDRSEQENSINGTSNSKKLRRRNQKREVQADEEQTFPTETTMYDSSQIGVTIDSQSKARPSINSGNQILPRMVTTLNDCWSPALPHTNLDGQHSETASGARIQTVIITCSDEGCAKKQFDASYLDRYCGIDINEVKDRQQRDQIWLCPECAHKAAVLYGHNGPVVHGSMTRLPKFGDKPLEDGTLRDFLRPFSGLLTDYSAKATNKPTAPNLKVPIWDIPCVRDEVLSPAAGRVNNFVSQLRQLLDVPDGVTIKAKVDICRLFGYRNSLWARGILVSLFSDAVFHQGSPFESDDILHQSLQYAGLQSNIIQSISQDCRTRTLEEDPQPKEYSERLQIRHQRLVQRLNNIMMPIVGCDSVFDRFHRGIAELAIKLNAHISTDTRGAFQEIRPVLGDLFDPQFHGLDVQEQDPSSFAGQPILVTTMIGIKYRVPGRDWRVCSRAEVELQRVPVSAGQRKDSPILPRKRPREG